MGAAGRQGLYALEAEASARGRLAGQLSALVAIGLIAASGGLLTEMNRKAEAAAQAAPAAQS